MSKKEESATIGDLEEYRVELEAGQDVTNMSVIRLPDGRQLMVKSIHGARVTKGGKTVVWGKGRHLRNVEV